VIPEIGIAGQIYRRSLFALTLDPDNPNFASSLRDGNLRRHVVHEVHHCLRKGGPGYGKSLGEALVSEGLAGQFVTRLFGTPPEPWERAVESPVALSLFPAADVMASTTYDHRAWFFGAGGQFPRWLGYTLGYMIVADGSKQCRRLTESRWLTSPLLMSFQLGRMNTRRLRRAIRIAAVHESAALSGRPGSLKQCPLSGVKRTLVGHSVSQPHRASEKPSKLKPRPPKSDEKVLKIRT
jgi:Predicted Zn-dependent protease (DUF2268)